MQLWHARHEAMTCMRAMPVKRSLAKLEDLARL